MKTFTKISLIFFAMLLVGPLQAMDNAAWLAKAQSCAEDGFMIDSDETPEDGVYCLVLALIGQSPEKSDEARVGEAVLEAKRKITAFVHGEKVSASTSLDVKSETVTNDNEKIEKSYKKFEKQIKTKVNSLVKCIKIVGQVSSNDKSYVVCVTCEKYEDQSGALAKAQAEYGEEGVVASVGEAINSELATQKAIRGAVEQVLGTVVVGYDKAGSEKDFQSKVFAGTDGVVETYRILSETEIATGKRIEIVAKVSKKNLLDNYSNYMKFLGDPGFYIASNSEDLNSYFTDFFTEMGIRITPTVEEASYIIDCSGTFRQIQHPVEDKTGVQLSLRFQIHKSDGKEVLIDMKNDPRKSSCFVGNNPDRQCEICAKKAFRQMQKPLHERIQKMVGKLVGRKMEESAEIDDED